MTSKLDSLRALQAAVKAGEAKADHFRAVWPGYMGTTTPTAKNAGEAFDGSLDAALALHKAVLPGHGWGLSHVGAYVCDLDGRAEYGEATDPARAWLLAILAALVAQEERGA